MYLQLTKNLLFGYMENTVVGLGDAKINNFLRILKFGLCRLHPASFPHHFYKLYVCICLLIRILLPYRHSFLFLFWLKTTGIYCSTVEITD